MALLSGKPVVLIVDDNPANLKVLYDVLSEADYEMRIEVDAHNALAQIAQQPPDLILLDVMLSDLNGFEMCRQLKANPQTQSIPIIFMTALADPRDKLTGLSLGAVDYITKPFHHDEVLARVRLHLKIYQLTRTLEAQTSSLQQLTHQLEQRTAQLEGEILERQQVTKALRHVNQAIEERLTLQERAIAASNNGIVIVDARQPGCPTIFVNPAFEKITGYTAAEVLGHNCRFLQGKDWGQSGLVILRQALKTGTSCTVTLKNYRKDGSLFWNELSISPIYDDQGNLTHYIGIQTDISDRVHA
ncbi:MAG: response regulator, partial [Synechocystis sp.]